MSDISEVKNSLYKMVEVAIKKSLEGLSLTKYYRAEIVNILGDGKYVVNIDNQEYITYASINMLLSVRDKIWVVAPNGNFNKKFICGVRQ